ncbi:uncharacterized protein EDB93DRAFT_1240853 [Suillus bovinus]|uniref:uncharacterized protein n=1 Tax=Suillus bovinus TaxID=48563 RepID=UPI001B8608D7|nr:uncharacterized protein EDB93DRAFT_1240853 [Suillus bovinus]KAG2146372.1 hypothetical protein EDB93DRAFT_1240853 [Suillus bovinus]
MISCNFLTKIHNALVDVKGNTAPFGGINIIFARDFAQLSPVTGKQLYAHLDLRCCATTQGQKSIFGRLLWLSISTVVLSTKIIRQSGPENKRFVESLTCLHEGKLITTSAGNTNHCKWKDAPIIVCDNESKDELNIRMMTAFAKRTGRTLHWYHSFEFRKNKHAVR